MNEKYMFDELHEMVGVLPRDCFGVVRLEGGDGKLSFDTYNHRMTYLISGTFKGCFMDMDGEHAIDVEALKKVCQLYAGSRVRCKPFWVDAVGAERCEVFNPPLQTHKRLRKLLAINFRRKRPAHSVLLPVKDWRFAPDSYSLGSKLPFVKSVTLSNQQFNELKKLRTGFEHFEFQVLSDGANHELYLVAFNNGNPCDVDTTKAPVKITAGEELQPLLNRSYEMYRPKGRGLMMGSNGKPKVLLAGTSCYWSMKELQHFIRIGSRSSVRLDLYLGGNYKDHITIHLETELGAYQCQLRHVKRG